MNRPAVLVVLSLLIAGCGASEVTESPTGAAPVFTTVEPARAPVTVKATDELQLGQPARTALGNVVTAHAFEEGLGSDTSDSFAAADIEACAGPKPVAGVTAASTPVLFVLELADKTFVERAATAGIKEPALPARALKPNQCTRGWVVFRLTSGQRPSHVVFRSSSLVRWRVN